MSTTKLKLNIEIPGWCGQELKDPKVPIWRGHQKMKQREGYNNFIIKLHNIMFIVVELKQGKLT